ncbi:LysR family transcriptional regulator substrate-binding protein [Sphingomonas sp. LR61]|uniref:LysR family transcriptional regulator substrate-binding protein n=1 Tax=Sphingomonas sp. LR61 TaxID=3050234 RepID=UPI003FA73136
MAGAPGRRDGQRRPRDLPVGGRTAAARGPHPDARAPRHRADARRRGRQRGEFAPLAADHDIAVGHRSDGVRPADQGSVETVPLLREPLDVALPPGHRLAGRERVGIDEVVGETWIGVPEGYPIDRVLQAMAAASDAPPSVAFRTIHLPVIENLVAAGHGVALVPRYTSGTRASGRFHLAELADVRAGRRIEALVRPDRAVRPVVRTVLEALVAEALDVTT